MTASPGYYIDRGGFPPATTLHRLDDLSRDRVGVMLRTGAIETTRWIEPTLQVLIGDWDETIARTRFLLEHEHWFRLAHARGGYS